MKKLLECAVHGIKVHRYERDIKNGKDYGKYRCSVCRQGSRNRTRKKNKKILVKEAGNKCVRCDYNKCYQALQFHHIDKDTKSFTISDTTRSLDQLREESKKCILLCANCHTEEHAKNYDLK